MNLADIAHDLRADALAEPGQEQDQKLQHGASVHLRADVMGKVEGGTEIEWHFKVQRQGKMPLEASREYAAWLRELATFRDEKYFNVPAQVEARMLETANHRHYAAAMVWTEIVESVTESKPSQTVAIEISPLPSTPEEMRAWAQTLGQGVQIRGVNVFTGEL